MADDHGGLYVTEKGHALAAGDAAFAYRPATPVARIKGRTDAAATSGDPALLAALKALRMKLARERQVPAFVIFSDRSLIDMAEKRPANLDAFAAVHGVGAAKLKDFGKPFLAVISQAMG